MDAPDMALNGQGPIIVGRLYIAFELGEVLEAVTGRRRARAEPMCRDSGQTASVLVAITKAKARFHLTGDAPVHTCYEAGRDGFGLHRWLSGQGVANLVVDPARIEENPRTRRAKARDCLRASS
jgi:transposase